MQQNQPLLRITKFAVCCSCVVVVLLDRQSTYLYSMRLNASIFSLFRFFDDEREDRSIMSWSKEKRSTKRRSSNRRSDKRGSNEMRSIKRSSNKRTSNREQVECKKKVE